ncbi:FG-GAP-like repeat-containing protein [Sphingomonas glaciei]|uniref:FG-GAP-like repeat-containing protein n=1 Tax=Sphingomonas glaciei TaxID=2938948 RepID=A0ABY5MYD6_9SPHN|nr:FG-GAP-like repeat-containing protein [Sphingomonas glaciei]
MDFSSDTIFERVNEGIDTVLTYSNYFTLQANVENLTIAVPRSASLTGNSLDNRIVGGTGNDRLYGLEGNDTLIGNSGIDTAINWGVDRSAATVERVAGGPLRISSLLDGTDVASGVELVRFSDGLYSFEFGDPEGPSLAQFGGVTGGWSSQERYPRHLADVNGDGFADIVGFGQLGVLVSYGSPTGGFSDQVLAPIDFGHAAGWTSDLRFHRQLADVNGDGRADIVGFGQAGTLVALGKADGGFASPILAIVDYGANQGWTDQDRFARTLGDVNGDGRADIVGFGSAGILVSFGRADGGFQSPILALSDFTAARGWSSNDLFPRDVADVDGDGRADIVGFGTAGTYFAYAKADGTFATPIFVFREFGTDQGWTSQDRFTRRVADVNGDGFADVVGFGEAGTYVAFGYDPTGYGIDESLKPPARLFAPAFDLDDFGNRQGWRSDTITDRDLGDVNNDGLLDIVGFGPSGILIALNQGSLLSS